MQPPLLSLLAPARFGCEATKTIVGVEIKWRKPGGALAVLGARGDSVCEQFQGVSKAGVRSIKMRRKAYTAATQRA